MHRANKPTCTVGRISVRISYFLATRFSVGEIFVFFWPPPHIASTPPVLVAQATAPRAAVRPRVAPAAPPRQRTVDPGTHPLPANYIGRRWSRTSHSSTDDPRDSVDEGEDAAEDPWTDLRGRHPLRGLFSRSHAESVRTFHRPPSLKPLKSPARSRTQTRTSVMPRMEAASETSSNGSPGVSG